MDLLKYNQVLKLRQQPPFFCPLSSSSRDFFLYHSNESSLLPLTSLKLQLLKLSDSLLQAPLLRIQILQLAPLNLLQLRANLLLIPLIAENLVLPLNAQVRLLQLPACFRDLAVDIDATLDVQEDGGGRGHGRDYAAGGPGAGG